MLGVGVGVPAGVGVGVPVGVGVGVPAGVGVTVAFCTLTAMMSTLLEPSVPVTVAFSWCVPFANLVVSIKHCVPSEGELSVLSAVESIMNATLFTLPEVLL